MPTGTIPASRITLAICLVLVVPLAVRADDELRLPLPDEPFPVLAWYGPPESETTLERYRELAAAGFTHNLSFLKSADAAAKALDIAAEVGVKQIVACRELLGADAEATVQRLKDYRALAAYHLRDEPAARDFAALAEQMKRIRAVDDRHPCYVNLFPNYGSTGTDGQLGTDTYQEYVDRFTHEVPVEFFSFDHYPIIKGDPESAKAAEVFVRPEWYDNLHVIAAAARKAAKPLWGFALSVPHDRYPPPTAAHLRLQVNSNLAYGIQTLQYFTYWTPTEIEFDFHDAPIASDGTRSAVYDLVRQMNRELQARRGVFLGSRVLSVHHTGETLPEGTEPFRPLPPIQQLITGANGVVVSHLNNGNRRFLVIVNRDFHLQMPLTITLDDSTPAAHVVESNGDLRALRDRNLKLNLEPGEMCVLTWNRQGLR